MKIICKGEAIAYAADEPFIPGYALPDGSLSVNYPLDTGTERAINYLTTVPKEWDLFIRQCLEKWQV